MALSSVESPTKLVEILLQVRLVEAVMRSHDERAEIADEGMHVRQDDVGLALTNWVPVMHETMVFE